MTNNNFVSWYKTIFVGELVQDSAMSIGGTSGEGGYVDDPMARDGQNRLTLWGTTQAGALIDTVRKLGWREPPKCITAGSAHASQSKAMPESVWRFFTSHANGGENIEIRQGVGIRQDTSAAADGALFDFEASGRGTIWPFCLDVSNHAYHVADDLEKAEAYKDAQNAERIAAVALLEWARGSCWIGRNVARGLGWMRLRNLRAYRLNLSHLGMWPDSRNSLSTNINRIHDECEKIPAEIFREKFELNEEFLPPLEKRWRYISIEGTLSAGERTDGYGIDAISVGGHAANQANSKWRENYLSPKSRDRNAIEEGFTPDSTFIMTKNSDGRMEPFLPGSGIRGVFRHLLSHRARRLGVNGQIHDPLKNPPISTQEPRDRLEKLFGCFSHSARLLFRDAYLCSPEEDWKAAWVQHHAEDEFTAGVYEGSKFDRIVLLKGTFSWKAVIEGEDRDEVNKYWEDLKPVLRAALSGHVPVGGGVWRGVGWPKWEINLISTHIAGEDSCKTIEF